MCSPALHAQTDSSIGVGVALTLYDPANPDAHHSTGVGIVGRLRRGSGLGATIGFDWFTSDVQVAVDGQPAALGTITIRPVMAGVSYIRQYRRYAISGAIVAGWSFNSIRQNGDLATISNCPAVRPDVTVWYELGHHFAASASVSYMFSRPTVTTTRASGQRSGIVNLNATVITFGFVYGAF